MTDLLPKLPLLLLLIARVSAIFVSMPVFSHRAIPRTLRAVLALMFTWMLSYVVPPVAMDIDLQFGMLLVRELMIGLMIGLLAAIIMAAIQIAGGLIDFQMGFAIANVIDPQNGTQSPLLGQIFNTLALLLFLGLDGHHLLLDSLFYSYRFLPIQEVWPAFGSERFLDFCVRTFAAMFGLAFQMAVPIIATLFLVDVALGITARTVPQLNIFVIGFPVKIAVGFAVLFIMLSVMIGVFQKLFEFLFASIQNFMTLLGGG